MYAIVLMYGFSFRVVSYMIAKYTLKCKCVLASHVNSGSLISTHSHIFKHNVEKQQYTNYKDIKDFFLLRQFPLLMQLTFHEWLQSYRINESTTEKN